MEKRGERRELRGIEKKDTNGKEEEPENIAKQSGKEQVEKEIRG